MGQLVPDFPNVHISAPAVIICHPAGDRVYGEDTGINHQEKSVKNFSS